MSVASLECLHLQAGEGTLLNVIGSTTCIKLSAEQTGGAFTLIETYDPPGIGIPLHYHIAEDETFYILEGQVEFVVGDRTIIAKKGDTIFGVRNVPHSWKVVGDTKARMLVLITPGGIDRMFEELAELCETHMPSPEQIYGVCTRYNIQFVPSR